MTKAKALIRVMEQLPEGFQAHATLDTGDDVLTLPASTLLRDWFREELESYDAGTLGRDEFRWKLGESIPNIDLPGWTRYVYRQLGTGEAEIITVHIDPGEEIEVKEDRRPVPWWKWKS